jgi:hypothetical protein
LCDCVGLSLRKAHKRPLWIDNCNPFVFITKERDQIATSGRIVSGI